MGRSRSRSPRRKERRRSRSRDKEDGEKKLDKFGRDVSERHVHVKSSREEPRKRDDRRSRDYGREYKPKEDDRGRNRAQETTYNQNESRNNDERNSYEKDLYEKNERTPHERNPYDDYDKTNQYHDNQPAVDPVDEKRQRIKEMFQEKEELVDDESRKMQQLMGFGGFDTTKGKKHADISGFAKVNKPQKYRQYMNRRGGFNRPLDWVG